MKHRKSKAPPVTQRDRWGTRSSQPKAGPPGRDLINLKYAKGLANRKVDSMEYRALVLGRPSLRSVNYTRYFYSILGHAVNDKKRKRRHRQFPRAFHASHPAAMGKGAQ
jgi:hypothetical protein